jgi:hypothetical protein
VRLFLPTTLTHTTLSLRGLAGAVPNHRFSPYCWRTRMALAHEGLTFETIPQRFNERAPTVSEE